MSKSKPKPKRKVSSQQKNKGGRPTKFSRDVLLKICEKLSEGIPLRRICRSKEMPAWRTVYDWMKADEDVSASIARARDLGYDAIAEETLDIADDGLNDTYVDDQGNKRIDMDIVQRSKLRIETRLKLLAKWNPKKYGDKLEVKTDGKFIPLTDLAARTEQESEEE